MYSSLASYPDSIRRGDVFSSGKAPRPRRILQGALPVSAFKNLIDRRFHRLTVISRVTGTIHTTWLCRCDCGSLVAVRAGHLLAGKIKSCKCLRADIGQELRENSPSGRGFRAEEWVWRGMKRRCYDPNCKSYADYGGRGIKVCERWQHFANFLADMGPRPSPHHQLDRFPDNNGDYRPGNCRWVVSRQNNRNRRDNHRIMFDGKNLCLAEWSELTGISRHAIVGRLTRGWSIKATLTTPMRHVLTQTRKD